MSNSKKMEPRKKVALELLHYRLRHRSTKSLVSGDTANVWQDAEIRIDPDTFGTSCQIYSMNKKSRSKDSLKSKAPFKWVYVYYSRNSTKTFDK